MLEGGEAQVEDLEVTVSDTMVVAKAKHGWATQCSGIRRNEDGAKGGLKRDQEQEKKTYILL